MNKHSVEQTAAQTLTILSSLPAIELMALKQAHRDATDRLSALASDSPELQTTVAELSAAEMRIGMAIGAVLLSQKEGCSYVASLGLDAVLPSKPVTLPEAIQDAPFVHTTAERTLRLDSGEKKLGIGKYADTATAAANIRNDTIPAQDYPIINEALRVPAERSRALAILERLLWPEQPAQGLQYEKHTTCGAALAGNCADVLLALAAQQDDPLLANQVKRIILRSFETSSSMRPQQLVAFASNHLVPRIHSSLEHLKCQRAVLTTGLSFAHRLDAEQYIDSREQKEAVRLADFIANVLKQDTAARPHIAAELIQLATRADMCSAISPVLNRLYENPDGRHALLHGFGFAASDLENDWTIGYGQQPGSLSHETIRAKNMETIFQLEQFQHGAARALHDALGIRNFERYPVALLEEAHRALQHPPHRYILYAIAASSHNGAFRDKNDDLERMLAKAKATGTTIIPAEFSSQADIRRIRQQRRQAGWRAAEHAIICAHGSLYEVATGQDASGRPISIDTRALRTGHPRGLGDVVKSIVQPGGTITLVACNTAANKLGGFARSLAESTGLTITAPDRVVQPVGIDLVYDPATDALLPAVNYKDSATGADVQPTTFHPVVSS